MLNSDKHSGAFLYEQSSDFQEVGELWLFTSFVCSSQMVYTLQPYFPCLLLKSTINHFRCRAFHKNSLWFLTVSHSNYHVAISTGNNVSICSSYQHYLQILWDQVLITTQKFNFCFLRAKTHTVLSSLNSFQSSSGQRPFSVPPTTHITIFKFLFILFFQFIHCIDD